MKVWRMHEVPPVKNSEALSGVIKDKTVLACGVVEFAPGTYAHKGEKHSHDSDEIFVILCGEITVPIVGGETDIARVGDWAYVAAGEEHHLTNHTLLPCVAIFMIVK